MCKVFPTMLKGSIRVWFTKIAPNTLSTFKELSGHFITHFIGRGIRGPRQAYWTLRNRRIRAWGHMWLGSTKKCFWLMRPTIRSWSLLLPTNSSLESFFSHLQKWPKDNGWHAIQGHEVHENWESHDSLRWQTKEEREARWPTSRQRKEVCSNEWPKRRQKAKTST